MAAQIANTWAAAFIERSEEVISKETSNTYEFVTGQLEKAKLILKTAEEEFETFQKTDKLELLKEGISGKIKQIVKYESLLDDVIRSGLVEKARYDELIAQIVADMKLKITELDNNLEKQRIGLEKTNEEIQKENKYIPVDKGADWERGDQFAVCKVNSERANTTINISML
jgi:uncharacterized protein involved in exopolysaccharide biosynthesis